MKIVESLTEYDSLPVIAWPEFLQNQSGTIKVGYFVEGGYILPFAIRKKSLLKWMQLYTEVLNCEDPNQEKVFLNSCMSIIKGEFNISHVMTSNTAIFRNYPDGADYCKWGSYKVDLTHTEDELFSALHSKHRNVIRRAQSTGLLVLHGKEYAKDVVKLMSDTYSRQGSKFEYGDAYIQNLNKLGENVDWWVVKDNEGELHGSAVFLWSKGPSCYYLHGGSSAHTSPGAMNLLIWEAMVEMKRRGVLCFDFVGARLTTEEGSKLEGIQRFKSRFGSEMDQGYMFRYVVSPIKYKLYNSALKAFYLLHGRHGSFDIIEQEREKGNY